MQAIICGQGRQQFNYVQHKDEIVPAKLPGGGSFSVMVFNLGFFYQEHQHWRNIWTQSNENFDLCRYTGMSVKIFRPPTVDVICTVIRSYPMLVNSGTHPSCHPQRQLLQYKKYIIESLQRKPHGRKYKKIKVKPPALLNNRWFFQRDFCDANLVKLSAAAASFRFPSVSHGSQGPIFTVYALNMNFYANSNWLDASQKTYGYVPFQNPKFPIYFKYTENKQDKVFTYNPNTFTGDKYFASIKYSTGIFSPKVLFAKQIVQGGDTPSALEDWSSKPGYIASLPIIPLRYNPHQDTGHGNQVYLTSLMRQHYDKPSVTEALFFDNVPLYTAFYGYPDFILQDTKDKGVLDTHMFVVKCDALHPISQNTKQSYYPIIDIDYASGKLPWDEYLSQKIKDHWYPTAEWQKITINNFVTSGPYVPKFDPGDKDSTWQLNYKYNFFLSGEDLKLQTQQLKTRAPEKNTLCPIQSSRQYRYPTQNNSQHKAFYMSGISEGDLLQQQLLKECQKTSKLIHLSNLMTQSHPQKRERPQKSSQPRRRNKKKSKNVSSHSAKSLHAKSKRRTYSSSSTNSSSSSTASKETSSNSSLT